MSTVHCCFIFRGTGGGGGGKRLEYGSLLFCIEEKGRERQIVLY